MVAIKPRSRNPRAGLAVILRMLGAWLERAKGKRIC